MNEWMYVCICVWTLRHVPYSPISSSLIFPLNWKPSSLAAGLSEVFMSFGVVALLVIYKSMQANAEVYFPVAVILLLVSLGNMCLKVLGPRSLEDHAYCFEINLQMLLMMGSMRYHKFWFRSSRGFEPHLVFRKWGQRLFELVSSLVRHMRCHVYERSKGISSSSAVHTQKHLYHVWQIWTCRVFRQYNRRQ